MYNVELQHKKKKYHAIERVKLLLDRGSFRETGSQVCNYGHTEGEPVGVPYDGVITGYGTVGGRRVFVFSQDFTVKAGTIGRRHGEQIALTLQRAVQSRCPIVGIYDSGGARIDETINALAGCADMLHWTSLASGSVPQIAVVLGPCAGAAAYAPALSDFVFMVDPISNMFITGPDVVKSVTGCTFSQEELGGARVHSTTSGVAHFCYRNEKACFSNVRRLLSLLPSSCDESPASVESVSPSSDRPVEIPQETRKIYDIKQIIDAVLDEDSFLEIQEEYAKSMVVGLGRLYGRTVGIVANQPLSEGGVINCDASDKAARFVRFCDAFNIPILTLVDTPGYMPGIQEEHNGILRHGAKLLYAYTEATTIKLTVILRKAYGGAYIAMGSAHLGADRVYVLPTAEIAVMGAEAAVSVIYKKRLAAMEDKAERAEFLKQETDRYCQTYMNAAVALHEGFVDELLQPEELRSRLRDDIAALSKKIPMRHIPKKHGNLPL